MADVTKTVEVVFKTIDNTGSGVSDVQKKIEDLDTAGKNAAGATGGLTAVDKVVKDLDTSAKTAAAADGGLGKAKTAIGEIDKSSSDGKRSVEDLKGKLIEIGEKAGLPASQLDDFNKALLRIGTPTTGGAAVAAVGLATLLAAGLLIGAEAFEFETKVKNLGGTGEAAAKEFDFVKKAADILDADIKEVATSYGKLLVELSGQQAQRPDIQNTFVGFSKLFEAVGGKASDAVGPTKDFIKAIDDDNINAAELKDIGEKVPGFLDAFGTALGVPVTKLGELAAEGKLNNDEIGKLQKYLLEGFKYDSLTPVIGAFKDLWDEVKKLADDLGVDGIYGIAIFAIEKTIRTISLAISAGSGFVVAFGESLANLAITIKTWDWGGFASRQNEIVDKFIDTTKVARDKLLGLGDDAQKFEGGKRVAKEVKDGAEASNTELGKIETKAGDVDKALKALGLDPKKFTDNTGTILAAFNTILQAPGIDGSTILQSLASTLTKLGDGPESKGSVEYLKAVLDQAFKDGKISADDYAGAVNLIGLKLDGAITKTDGIKDAAGRAQKPVEDLGKAKKELADQAERAADRIDKTKIELEKLASNERIKTFEAKIKLDIANVEANAKIAVSIIDGIAKTYDSNIGLIKDVLAQVGDGYSAADKVRLQIVEDANRRVEELHTAQLAVVAAQVEYLRAKSAALAAGSPLISVQGDGLAPHLEAIMWEIFSKIQVRMAFDGGDMLIGA